MCRKTRVTSYFRNALLHWLIISLVVSCNLSEVLAVPQPQWIISEADRRVLFSVPLEAGLSVLVKIPFDGLSTNSYFLYACDSAGKQLSTKLAFTDDSWAYVLVGIEDKQKTENYQLYAGRLSSNFVGQSSSGNVQDPLPVGVFIHRPISRSPPLEWGQMLHMYSRAGPPVVVHRTHYFGTVELPALTSGRDKSGGPHKLGRLVCMKSNLVCSRSGWYTFALGCRSVSFLVVDGKTLISDVEENNVGEWVESEPVWLKAGVYPLEIFTFCEESLSVKVGRRYSADRPTVGMHSRRDVKEILRIPHADLITPFEAQIIRIERTNRVLQPWFRWNILPAYAYRICKACNSDTTLVGPFIPVKFLDTTTSWTNVPYETIWDVPTTQFLENEENVKEQARRREVIYVYFGADMHNVQLIVRDKYGHQEQCVQTIDCRRIVPVEFKVEFDVSSLESIYFPSDEVTANMIISSKLPVTEGLGRHLYSSLLGWKKIQLTWNVQYSTGSFSNGQSEVILDEKRSVEIPLISGRMAGELKRVGWTAKNEGVEIASGEVRFNHPPFEFLPASVCGNRLLDTNGVQLVLVPYESALLKKSGILSDESVGTVGKGALSGRRVSLVWIDENLCLENTDDTNSDFIKRLNSACVRLIPNYRVNYIPILPCKSMVDSYGPLNNLLKSVSVAKNAVAGYTDENVILVLSVGGYALSSGVSTEVFQRYIASLCDLVARLPYRRVVLLTPPPYSLMKSKVRQFAQAILRVADIRQLVVADIYSVFMCRKNTERLWNKRDSLGLSSDGIDLTVLTVKTALENMNRK